TEELVSDIALLAPQHVVPFADGLLYRDDRINAWHFPLPDEEFLRRMAQRGIRGSVCAPGTVFVISADGVDVRDDEGHLITIRPRKGGDRTFNPHRRLPDTPMPCADWTPALGEGTDTASAALPPAIRARVEENVPRPATSGPLREQADRLR